MKRYDVIIIGGGVSGTALLHVLGNYSSVKRILLLEKHRDVAQVASHYTQNSQTLHFGDIESNYSFEKAQSVSAKAELVKHYVESVGKSDKAHVKGHKILLAVGDEEVERVTERVKEFKKIFPNIKLLDRNAIAKLEPKIVEGRDPGVALAALYSPDGYVMDYHNLAKSFVKQTKKRAGIDVKMNTEVLSLEKNEKGYLVKTNKGTFSCDVLVSDAGGMSIHFAKMLGYGKHLTIMSLGGNFYRGPDVLNGKVYTMQHPKRPNAALHGDPDVRGKGYTRFGPTANILFSLERRNSKTIWPYFKSVNYTPKGIWSIIKTGLDPAYGVYIVQNMLYDIPYVGNRLLLPQITKIVPTVKASEIKKEKGYGSGRPQIIDAKLGKVNLGEARIEAPNAIFNITPSPGASTCLANAVRDANEVCAWLGERFDEKKFKSAIGVR
jgi:malate dehydrogenase (quinone)